ncbi:MAG: MBL fold metallo-hydrolase [Desulfobacterales bacterium]|nr:MBL fold metallo-hydrolase [Desulfobacterales bacterium]
MSSKRPLYTATLALALAVVLIFGGCALKTSHPAIPAGANRDLVQHSKIFAKGVEKVSDNIHVAIGYGISNSIMIEGDDGVIIVDTMTTREEAAEVLAEFRTISDKPVMAIIYTHSHPDHVFGADVFAQGSDPAVYAHESTEGLVKHLLTEVRPCIGTRSMRMYGNFLAPGQVHNVGIGPRVGIGPESTMGFVRPTRTFSDRLTDEVAGIRFELIHAPGETDDQIVVWLPDQKVLIPGDNFYWAFPNLYTIRGTPFRSLKNWYRSIDAMRDLPAEYLVPCHSRPIVGKERIGSILTDYRDAIQYVHDQSIRGMNMGMTPDELAETVILPPHLASAPYLQHFYGKVSWSARSMFAGTLGWFDGDAATLQPLTRREEAILMARLAGGEAALLDHARRLVEEQAWQAALALTGHLIRLNPELNEARDLRIAALTALAGFEQNPNARHYYMTEALEIRDRFVVHETVKPSAASIRQFTLSGFFDSLAVNLDPEKSAAVDEKVLMVFPDAGEAFTIHVRHGVAEIRKRSLEGVNGEDFDLNVIANADAWKEMLAKIRNPVATLAGFQYPKGNVLGFTRFMTLFTPAKHKLPVESLDSVKRR